MGIRSRHDICLCVMYNERAKSGNEVTSPLSNLDSQEIRWRQTKQKFKKTKKAKKTKKTHKKIMLKIV